MTNKKHPFDLAAEQLEAIGDSPTHNQTASMDFWEIAFAADESVGDFPQAVVSEEYAFKHWSESDGLGDDGFPEVPEGIPEQTLQSTALWTDVLSSNLCSDGFLLNEPVLDVFKQFAIGNYREYPTSVVD